jgi:hypothetical protein
MLSTDQRPVEKCLMDLEKAKYISARAQELLQYLLTEKVASPFSSPHQLSGSSWRR